MSETELRIAVILGSTRPGRNGKAGLPAWKRIEELREMRELNRHIKDDIYGSKPVRALWSE